MCQFCNELDDKIKRAIVEAVELDGRTRTAPRGALGQSLTALEELRDVLIRGVGAIESIAADPALRASLLAEWRAR